ncbi:MAG: hypothetical protein KDB14_21855 [Planctomycetales bacterium]|nr:hypothetical protein [Planctomycetales bacterium]
MGGPVATMSGCLTFLIVLFVFFAVTTGIPLPRRDDRGRAWRRLSRDLNAVFTGVGMLSPLMMRFRYGAARVTVSSNRKLITVSITWPDTSLECELVTPGFSRIGLRLPRVRMGDVNLDEQYDIFTSSSEAARGLLTANVRTVAERIRRQQSSAPMRITFLPGQLTVRKQARYRTYEQLSAFVRSCLELYDQAMLTRAEGINFCGDEEPDDFVALDEVKCQVCGDLINDDDLVFCRRCHTPHHEECWKYYGSCTVYGCQEDQFEHPQIAVLLDYQSPQPVTAAVEAGEGQADAAEAEEAEAEEAEVAEGRAVEGRAEEAGGEENAEEIAENQDRGEQTVRRLPSGDDEHAVEPLDSEAEAETRQLDTEDS